MTLAVLRPAMLRLTRTELLAGAAVGVTIFLGYALQTIGLQTIPASQSAFITALYVPMVPLLQLACRLHGEMATFAEAAVADAGR